jgi:hypothetical protein
MLRRLLSKLLESAALEAPEHVGLAPLRTVAERPDLAPNEPAVALEPLQNRPDPLGRKTEAGRRVLGRERSVASGVAQKEILEAYEVQIAGGIGDDDVAVLSRDRDCGAFLPRKFLGQGAGSSVARFPISRRKICAPRKSSGSSALRAATGSESQLRLDLGHRLGVGTSRSSVSPKRGEARGRGSA